METTVAYWQAKQKSLNNRDSPSSCSSSSNASSMDDEDQDSLGTDVVDNHANINGSIVWAGLEPSEFKSMFPGWVDREDVTQINVQVSLFIFLLSDCCNCFLFISLKLQDGRIETVVSISEALSQLSQKEHPLAVLLARPLPEGCDATRLELYLSEADFVPALGCDRNEFERMPLWKQTNLKKERGLF